MLRTLVARVNKRHWDRAQMKREVALAVWEVRRAEAAGAFESDEAFRAWFERDDAGWWNAAECGEFDTYEDPWSRS